MALRRAGGHRVRRPGRWGVVAVLVGLLAGASPAVTPAVTPAEAGGVPRVTAVTSSSSRVQVQGFDLATVVVRVTVADLPNAVTIIAMAPTDRGRIPDGSVVTGPPRLVDGTPTDGTYEATAFAPSTANGAWRVGAVTDEGPEGTGYSFLITPEESGVPNPVVTVVGTHRPQLRTSIRPDPVPWNVHRVRLNVHLADENGRSFGRRTIRWRHVSGCERHAGTALRADRHGHASTTLPTDGFVESLYVWLDLPAGVQLWDGETSCYLFVTPGLRSGSHVDAVLRGSPRPHGRARVVTGRVRTAYDDPVVVAGDRVELQRIVGRRWRTAARTTVRDDGTFRMTVTPSRRGTTVYRVRYVGQRPSDRQVIGSTSRVFRVVAT